MTERPKAWLAWSSGKDAAWALHVLREAVPEQGEVEVVGLLTTVTGAYERVSMHGVRESLLEAQARAVGLLLHKAVIPARCSNEDYEAVMAAMMARAAREGVTHVVFGDISLEDVRPTVKPSSLGWG